MESHLSGDCCFLRITCRKLAFINIYNLEKNAYEAQFSDFEQLAGQVNDS